MSAKVDALKVLRRVSNRAAGVGYSLSLNVPPAHCDYISKADAGASCATISEEIEGVFNAITALVAAARRARDHVRPTCSELYEELDSILANFPESQS
jgi:hypothetical protein